jgi:hypothetical protein
MFVKFKLYKFIENLLFCTKFKNRWTKKHKCIVKFDFQNSEVNVLSISSASPQQNLNISETIKAQTSGMSSQTSIKEAQTNDQIWFSKFQNGGAREMELL